MIKIFPDIEGDSYKAGVGQEPVRGKWTRLIYRHMSNKEGVLTVGGGCSGMGDSIRFGTKSGWRVKSHSDHDKWEVAFAPFLERPLSMTSVSGKLVL